MSSDESSRPAKASSVEVTTRYNRSLYTYLIQSLTRPFRNYLGRPKKQQPEGSITLKPYKTALKLCIVKERTVCDIHVYDIVTKRNREQTPKKRIYYFAGGGWQSPPSSQHWFNCAKLAREVPDTQVSLVSYPLAPKNAAPKAFPMLLRFYRQIMEDAVQSRENIILAGDSSGGNIILSLVLEALHEDSAQSLDIKARPHPIALFAICPSTDLTRSNPDIEKLASRDPLLTPKFIKSTAAAWHGEWDPKDRRVSPIHADVSLLAKFDVLVHGMTGGHDILSPDGIIFRDRLAQEGVKGKWLHWEKQMHCFVLTQAYKVPEGREAIKWMIKVLSEQ